MLYSLPPQLKYSADTLFNFSIHNTTAYIRLKIDNIALKPGYFRKNTLYFTAAHFDNVLVIILNLNSLPAFIFIVPPYDHKLSSSIFAHMKIKIKIIDQKTTKTFRVHLNHAQSVSLFKILSSLNNISPNDFHQNMHILQTHYTYQDLMNLAAFQNIICL